MGIVGTRIPGWARELQPLPGPAHGDPDRGLLPNPRAPRANTGAGQEMPVGTLTWRARVLRGTGAQAETKTVLLGDLLGPCLGLTEGPGNLGWPPHHPHAGGLCPWNPSCPRCPSRACGQHPHSSHGQVQSQPSAQLSHSLHPWNVTHNLLNTPPMSTGKFFKVLF